MFPSTAWQCTSVEEGISPPTISTALKAYTVHKEFPVLHLVLDSLHSLQQPAWREHGPATGAKPRPHSSSAQCTASPWEGGKEHLLALQGKSRMQPRPRATARQASHKAQSHSPSLLTSWGFRYFPSLMTSVFIFMSTNTHPTEN